MPTWSPVIYKGGLPLEGFSEREYTVWFHSEDSLLRISSSGAVGERHGFSSTSRDFSNVVLFEFLLDILHGFFLGYTSRGLLYVAA